MLIWWHILLFLVFLFCSRSEFPLCLFSLIHSIGKLLHLADITHFSMQTFFLLLLSQTCCCFSAAFRSCCGFFILGGNDDDDDDVDDDDDDDEVMAVSVLWLWRWQCGV